MGRIKTGRTSDVTGVSSPIVILHNYVNFTVTTSQTRLQSVLKIKSADISLLLSTKPHLLILDIYRGTGYCHGLEHRSSDATEFTTTAGTSYRQVL